MTGDYSTGFEAGARGEPFRGSGAQEYAGWAAGKAQWDARQPQTSVDGVSFTALICAQLVCAIYPIAGTVAIGSAVLAWLVPGWLGLEIGNVRILLALVLGLAAFFVGFGVERRMARLKPYRVLRDLFRLSLIAVFPFIRVDPFKLAAPTGEAFGVLLILIPVGYWILKRIDRAVGAAGNVA
jgi:hypothetical protein